MSEEEDNVVRSVKNEAEIHRMKALAPAGHLHPALGNLSKGERYYTGLLWVLGQSVTKRNHVIESMNNGKEVDKRSVDDAIAGILSEYPRMYINLSASQDGFRSKQITKANVASNAGPYVAPQEHSSDTGGWLTRHNPFRKKEKSVTD